MTSQKYKSKDRQDRQDRQDRHDRQDRQTQSGCVGSLHTILVLHAQFVANPSHPDRGYLL